MDPIDNTIANQGNHNIIIQGITDSSITLEVNGATQEIQNELSTLSALLEQLNAKQVQLADQMYDLKQLEQANLGLKKTFNVLMTKKLTLVLAENGLQPAQRFLEKTKSIEGWEHDSRFANVAKNLITFAFVGVIGTQLRKIIAIGKEALSERKQQKYIANCYLVSQKALQLLSFTLISSFWDVQKNANYALNEAESKALKVFFDDSIERDLVTYASLLELLIQLFRRHQIPLTIEELDHLDINKFKKTCTRIQKLHQLLEKSQHSLLTCFEIEGQLTHLLSHLVLLINYEMLSVKRVVYDEKRSTPPQFIHSYIALGIDQKFNENTEKLTIINTPVVTDAVLIHSKKNHYQKHINLSPFIIDYNTQLFEKGAQICFFAAKHISDGSLNYRFLEDNSEKNIEFSNALTPHTKLEDLMRDPVKYSKWKLDILIQQFEAAKKELFKNSATGNNTEEPAFDDLFD